MRIKGEDKRMGYCFDVAVDERRNKLYVVAGDLGIHVFRVQDGELHFITSLRDEGEEGYYRNLKIAGDRLFLADFRRGLGHRHARLQTRDVVEAAPAALPLARLERERRPHVHRLV